MPDHVPPAGSADPLPADSTPPAPLMPAPGAVAGEADLIDTEAAGAAALRGGVLRASGFAGGILASVLSGVLVLRYLGDVGFGQYSAVIAVVAIVGGLTEAGISTIALREFATIRDADARDKAMQDLLGLRLVTGVVAIALAVAISAAAGYRAPLVIGTFVAAIGLLINLLQSLFAAVLQSDLKFGWSTAIDLGRQLATAAALIVLVLMDASIVVLLAASIPVGVVALGVTGRLIRGALSLRPAFHPSRWGPLLRETAIFALAVAINSLYFRITLVIMSVVATGAQTGYFAISLRMTEVLIGVPAMLFGAIFPVIARAVHTDRPRFDRATVRMFELGVIVGAFVAMCVVLAAPFLVQILTGSMDHPSVPVLRIQAAGLLLTFVASATGYPLLSLRRNRALLVANLGSLVVAVTLTLLLASDHGAQGAATAAVCAELTLASLNVAFLLRAGGPRLPILRSAVVVFCAGAGLAAGLLTGVHPILDTAVGAVVFAGGLLATGRFPPEAREALSAILPRLAPPQ